MKKNIVKVKINLDGHQAAKLLELQEMFTKACDEVATYVSSSRSWHRVTLHHLAYKSVREKFPSLGSQMVCNAIHTVSRACREIFQDPSSGWLNHIKSGGTFPILRFTQKTPVFFDKHTLALKKNALSIFTLDGRIYIKINLFETIDRKLRTEKLKELSLVLQNNNFYFRFVFNDDSNSSVPIKPSVNVIQEPISKN